MDEGRCVDNSSKVHVSNKKIGLEMVVWFLLVKEIWVPGKKNQRPIVT